MSRTLLLELVSAGVPVVIPAFGLAEIACALARRPRDPMAGRELAIWELVVVRETGGFHTEGRTSVRCAPEPDGL